jgi:hypothetical protein
MACDELIDVAGRAAIQAVLGLSAQQVAGPRQQGKSTGEVVWYGQQSGTVMLSDRKLAVNRPRLRQKGPDYLHRLQPECREAAASPPPPP